MVRLWLTFAAACLIAAPLFAQPRGTPRVELGGSLAAVVPVGLGDGPVVIAGAGPRVVLNLSNGVGVEVLSDVLAGIEDSGMTGLFGAQLALPLTRSSSGRRRLSFTAGAIGLFAYQRFDERRVARPDGSTVVYPGYRSFRSTRPHTAIVGVTREREVGRRTSVALSAQALAGGIGGIALRGSVAVSVGVWRPR
jgi:hypothetical protein